MHRTKKITYEVFKDKRENRKRKIYSNLLSRHVKNKDRHIFGDDLDYISKLQPQSEILYKRIIISAFESGVTISDSDLSILFIDRLILDSLFRSIVNYLYKSLYESMAARDSYILANSLKRTGSSIDELREYLISAAKYLGTIFDCRKEFNKITLERQEQKESVKKHFGKVFPIGTIELEPLSYLDFYNIKVENLAWAAEILYDDFQLDTKCLFDY